MMQYFSDCELIVKLREGDPEGYRVLFMRYYMRVLTFIRGIIKSDWVAEDITQNVFMKLWLKHETLWGNSVNHLLFAIARNEIADYFRVQSYASQYRRFTAENPGPPENFEEDYDAAELQELVGKAVEGLSERRREIFHLSRKEYLSNKEIAERLGISVRTVEKHLEMALKQIRESLP